MRGRQGGLARAAAAWALRLRGGACMHPASACAARQLPASACLWRGSLLLLPGNLIRCCLHISAGGVPHAACARARGGGGSCMWGWVRAAGGGRMARHADRPRQPGVATPHQGAGQQQLTSAADRSGVRAACNGGSDSGLGGLHAQAAPAGADRRRRLQARGVGVTSVSRGPDCSAGGGCPFSRHLKRHLVRCVIAFQWCRMPGVACAAAAAAKQGLAGEGAAR